ncbi:MAG TPA: hypothetical protein VEW03_01385 [Longimicrobiaceae bacterium]|nr:hypothetical protein [Longimicrobiaceae bacterium]
MRLAVQTLLLACVLMGTPGWLGAQQPGGAIHRLESAVWLRVAERVQEHRAFTISSGAFDLALPLAGDPREIIGPTRHAREALAVASARLEPLDSVGSADDRFLVGRYHIRLEDRSGNCLVVHQVALIDGVLVRGARTTERCQPVYMADVVRRSRRLARLPFTLGRLDDHWSVASTATGFADVYRDSIVITTSTLSLRASHPIPDVATQQVDSISAGLALGDGSWSVMRESAAATVDTTLRRGGQWNRGRVRFTIPIDSTFPLEESWLVLQVHLSVPRTQDNPEGRAWTYAHGSRGFFVRRRERSSSRRQPRGFARGGGNA